MRARAKAMDVAARPGRVHRHAHDRPGFTLIEMVISMALLALVMAATMAVVALAARSAPDPNDPLAQQIAAQSVVDQIALDAGDASMIELVGKHEVRLTCDDLTGDDQPDTIVYSWSGVAGDPLKRTLNGVSRVVKEHVDGLAFTAEGVLVRTEGAVMTVTKADQYLVGVPKVGGGGSVTYVRSNAIAQRFKARIGTGAKQWTLKSVSLWLERDGLSESQGAVQIYNDNNGLPGSLLSQRTFSELSLSGSSTKETFSFSLSGLDPAAPYWIVIRASFLTSPCGVLHSSEPVASGDEMVASYNSSAGKWTTSEDASLLYEITGDVVVGEPEATIESRATALFARFTVANNTASSGVRLAHRPLLIVDDDAVVDVSAPQGLLDAVADSLDSIVDATGGLLGGLLGGGGGK